MLSKSADVFGLAGERSSYRFTFGAARNAAVAVLRVSRGASNDGRASATEGGDATGEELGDEAAAAVAVNVSAQTASALRTPATARRSVCPVIFN